MLNQTIDFCTRERWEIPTGPDACRNAYVYKNVLTKSEFLLPPEESPTDVRTILRSPVKWQRCQSFHCSAIGLTLLPVLVFFSLLLLLPSINDKITGQMIILMWISNKNRLNSINNLQFLDPFNSSLMLILMQD